MTSCRLITPDDASALAELQRVNRDFLAPWEPARRDDYFTEAGQRAAIEEALRQYEQGRNLPQVILDGGTGIVGRITLNSIVRGAALSCSVGYWVSQSVNGRGVATAALREIIAVAFAELGLHRIQGETLLDNVASQRVLERNGFARIGMAPTFLKIAGRWQDCILYQLINPSPVLSGRERPTAGLCTPGLRGRPGPVNRQHHVAVSGYPGARTAFRGDLLTHLPVVGGELARERSQVGRVSAALVGGRCRRVDHRARDREASRSCEELDDPGLLRPVDV